MHVSEAKRKSDFLRVVKRKKTESEQNRGNQILK